MRNLPVRQPLWAELCSILAPVQWLLPCAGCLSKLKACHPSENTLVSQTPNLGICFYAYLCIITEIAFLFVHLKWKKKKKNFGFVKGEFIHLMFFRVSGKTTYWMKDSSGSSKLTSFVSVSKLNYNDDRKKWWMAKEFFFTCWTSLAMLYIGLIFWESLYYMSMQVFSTGCAYKQVIFLRDTTAVT